MGVEELLREMMRDDGVFSIGDMIQNIIYFFNQTHIRDYVINYYLDLLPHGRHAEWDGTYYFNEKGVIDPYYHPDIKHKDTLLKKFLENRNVYKDDNKKNNNHDKKGKKKTRNYVLFTACILYEDNRVHFLSFIYDRARRVLVSFDPGVNLYHKGQDVLIPLIRDAFIRNNLIDKDRISIERVGLCSTPYFNKKFGIQYDGTDPETNSLPADSFCQSWTLFFLIEFLRHKCSDKFLSSWCNVAPRYREPFILTYYFLPWLQQDAYIHKEFNSFYPQSKNLPKLLQYVIDRFPTDNRPRSY